MASRFPPLGPNPVSLQSFAATCKAFESIEIHWKDQALQLAEQRVGKYTTIEADKICREIAKKAFEGLKGEVGKNCNPEYFDEDKEIYLNSLRSEFSSGKFRAIIADFLIGERKFHYPSDGASTPEVSDNE